MDWEEATRVSNELFTQAIPRLLADTTAGKGVPEYKRVDTSELDYDRARVRSQREVVSSTIQQNLQDFNTASAAEKAAIQAEGVAQAQGAEADQIKADRDAAVFAQYAKIFGITPENTADLVHDMNIQKPLLQAGAAEIASMQAVGPGDNLLEWWGNQFVLPGKISEYNTRAAAYNMMQETLDAYIKSAGDAATFTLRGLPSITAAQAKSKADFALAKAAEESAKVDENMAKVNVDFATKQLAADVAAAEKTMQTTELEVRQRQNEFQASIHAIQFSESQAMRLLKAAELAEKLAKNEDEMAQRKSIEVILKNYDRIMGHPTGTTNFNVWRVTNEAQRSNMIAIGVGSLGATPVSGMLNWYKSNPGALASPETSRFMEYIRSKAESWAITAQAQSLDEKQKIDFVNKKVTEELANEMKNASKLGNAFYELSPGKMIAAGQINPDSLVGKVLQPLTQGKIAENIPTGLVVETIRKGFNNDADAAKAIADYYSRNMQLRNSTMNAGILGLTLPTTYGVTTRIGALTSAQLDMTKFNDVMKYLQIKNIHEYQSAQQSPDQAVGRAGGGSF